MVNLFYTSYFTRATVGCRSSDVCSVIPLNLDQLSTSESGQFVFKSVALFHLIRNFYRRMPISVAIAGTWLGLWYHSTIFDFLVNKRGKSLRNLLKRALIFYWSLPRDIAVYKYSRVERICSPSRGRKKSWRSSFPFWKYRSGEHTIPTDIFPLRIPNKFAFHYQLLNDVSTAEIEVHDLPHISHAPVSFRLSFLRRRQPSGGFAVLVGFFAFFTSLNSLRKLICLFPNKHSFYLMLGNITLKLYDLFAALLKTLADLFVTQARCCLTHQMPFNEFCVSAEKD